MWQWHESLHRVVAKFYTTTTPHKRIHGIIFCVFNCGCQCCHTFRLYMYCFTVSWYRCFTKSRGSAVVSKFDTVSVAGFARKCSCFNVWYSECPRVSKEVQLFHCLIQLVSQGFQGSSVVSMFDTVSVPDPGIWRKCVLSEFDTVSVTGIGRKCCCFKLWSVSITGFGRSCCCFKVWYSECPSVLNEVLLFQSSHGFGGSAVILIQLVWKEVLLFQSLMHCMSQDVGVLLFQCLKQWVP